MSHKSEIEAIRKLIAAIGGVVYVLAQSQKLHGSAGIPDLIVFLPRKPFFCFVEVKPKGARQTDTQAEFQRRCVVAGIECACADRDGMITILQYWGYEIR